MALALGVTIFLTDTSIGVVELAKEVEARGFESLWVPEHTHIPVGRKTPYPGGEPLPEEYRRTHDPFVVLTAAAAVTTTLRVGTGISLVAQRDPIVTAKAVASLDHVSQGRFDLGIGFGWNHDEMEDHGVDPRTRRAKTREHVLAMRALWTEEEASFEGEHVHLQPTWSWPKPVQQPHPPVYIGGAAGPKMFDAVVDYADGWMPIGARGLTDNVPKLRAVAEAAGRDPDTIRLGIFAMEANPAKLEHVASLGAERAVFWLPPAGRETVLPLLDRYAELVTVGDTTA